MYPKSGLEFWALGQRPHPARFPAVACIGLTTGVRPHAMAKFRTIPPAAGSVDNKQELEINCRIITDDRAC